MKVTTGEALDALTALQTLVGEKMPVATGMQIRRIVRALTPVAEDYNGERQKLIERYAQKNGNGPKTDERGNILLADAVGWNAGHRELLAVEQDVDATLTVSALTESGINVEPRLLIGLGPLLVE